MNKNIKLAVAGAVLALSATANAGIIIPAGDWTVDLGGNVNAFIANVDTETTTAAGVRTKASANNSIGTGLLPSALGIGAKTRQNDVDTAIQFTFFTGSSAGAGVGGRNGSGGANNVLNIRQAFLTFGDKSWGTFKLGRDLGIFGSDAILSDMTLLGVGTGGQLHGGSSTLGRIGSGYIYADWKGQVSYSTPNVNGFQITAGAMENFGSVNQARRDMSYEAKATYDFAADNFSGRVWVGGLSQKSEGNAATTGTSATGRKVSLSYVDRCLMDRSRQSQTIRFSSCSHSQHRTFRLRSSGRGFSLTTNCSGMRTSAKCACLVASLVCNTWRLT